MIIDTFSARQIAGLQEPQFSPEKYSKFKYGSKSIAREFGHELGKKFLDSAIYRKLEADYDLTQMPILVSSAPYKFTPTASHALKDYFVHAFNNKHALKFSRSIEEIKIYRAHSYFDEYDSMSREARDSAITADDFYVDRKLIEGKILLLVDDIKITGSHQTRIEKLLNSVAFTGQVVFLFYAELTVQEDPQIEAVLNRKAVRDLMDINEIIKEDEFIFNTRVVKFILQSKAEDFLTFIRFQTKRFNETLLHYSIGNEYFKEPAFRQNFFRLQAYLDSDL